MPLAAASATQRFASDLIVLALGFFRVFLGDVGIEPSVHECLTGFIHRDVSSTAMSLREADNVRGRERMRELRALGISFQRVFGLRVSLRPNDPPTPLFRARVVFNTLGLF